MAITGYDIVAEATTCTGDAVVCPALGDETPTPANAAAVENTKLAAISKFLFKYLPSKPKPSSFSELAETTGSLQSDIGDKRPSI